MSALQLTRGLQYLSGKALRSSARHASVIRLQSQQRHFTQLSARDHFARRSIHVSRALGGADTPSSPPTPNSASTAEPLSEEQQTNSRNALHAAPSTALPGIDSRGMPEGDEDVEVLNSVSGSQPEAQLVTDKPTELPDGVQLDMVPQTAPTQDTTPSQQTAPAEVTAVAQDVVSAATQDGTAAQDLASAGFAIPTQDAVATDTPTATETLTTTDTPTAATAAQGLASAGFAIPSQDAVATDTPIEVIDSVEVSAVNKDWDTMLQEFLDMLSVKGHLSRPVQVNAFSIAVLKKAMLDFARSRQDILFVLPEDKIQAVLAAGVPYQERKLMIATKRLSTTFGDRQAPMGAEGSFQDLTRFIIAAAYSHAMHKGRVQNVKATDKVSWDSHNYNPALVEAVTDVLPDILAATEQPPTPEAQAKAEASALVREQKALTPQPIDHNSLKLRPSGATGEPRPEDRRQDRSRFFMEKGWDGFEKPAAGRNDRNDNSRPGDWTCPDCNQHNFARNRECFKCGSRKTDAAGAMGDSRQGRSMDRHQSSFGDGPETQQGDWNCSECGTSNFARRNRCFKCGIPRSKAELSLGQKPGDWNCSSCGANNFSRRTDCFRCQTPKPASKSYRSQGRSDSFSSPSRGFDSAPRNERAPRDADAAPFQYEAKPGDWACDSCGANNFARRGVCFKCGNSRSGGNSTMSTSGRAAGRVFDDKRQESSWFDGSDGSDNFGPSTSTSNSSSSTGWDPRTSLGAAEPKASGGFDRSPPSTRGGFDRAQPDFGRSSSGDYGRGGSSSRGGPDRVSRGREGGSSWERGEARPSRGRDSSSRGGRGGFSRGGSSSFSRGGSSSFSRGGSSRGGSSRGRNFGTSSSRPDNMSSDLPGDMKADKPWDRRPPTDNGFDFGG